jgi:DNA-directed RNA polymerase subunit beta'
LLAKSSREIGGTQDITGGLPRVTELFEARRPKEPAVISEIDGVVELGEKKRSKRTIIVRAVGPKGEVIQEQEHSVPQGKHLRVHKGDEVRAGDPLVDGPLVPHDILRIKGDDAAQEYLLTEIQNVYRSQGVTIDDKHIEIIIAQMLRKVKVDDPGDSGLLPGATMDRFAFRRKKDELEVSVKVAEPGDSDYKKGQTVKKTDFQQANNALLAEDQAPAKSEKPRLPFASVQLLGITKAAVSSDSFISAASFQETTKVLTQAALASKQDTLVGLKENVILGHLIPAGTGFKLFKEAEVRISEEALADLEEQEEEEIEEAPPAAASADGAAE